jgi:hypothetical protein
MENAPTTGTTENVPYNPKAIWVGRPAQNPSEESSSMSEMLITRDVFESAGADVLMMQIIEWTEEADALIQKIGKADAELDKLGFRRENQRLYIKAGSRIANLIMQRLEAARQSHMRSLGISSMPDAGESSAAVAN